MLSIGHEVSVSSVQMAGVFGCLANHGRLMKPLIIDRVISPTGGTIKRIYPEEIRAIFSDSTAALMRGLCAQVVDTGTAKYARLDGITFAGKTGTAEKPSQNGGYDKSRYIASFGGYFPCENPKICGLIMIDEPKKVNYGGITAAPAFAMTAKRIINLQNRKKNFAGGVMYAPRGVFKSGPDIPDNKEYQDSVEKMDTQMMHAENAGITIKPTNTGENGDSPLIFLPDLSGKSARTAVSMLLDMGLECSLEGMGNVIRSVPAGGSFAKPGEHVKLICSLNEKEVIH
jgi:membrane peptidoglycan carboxypeptidase